MFSMSLEVSGAMSRFSIMSCSLMSVSLIEKEICVEKNCNSRESNPGLIRGRDLSYHLTTIARRRPPPFAFSFVNTVISSTNTTQLFLTSSLVSHKRRSAHSVGLTTVEVGTLKL